MPSQLYWPVRSTAAWKVHALIVAWFVVALLRFGDWKLEIDGPFVKDSIRHHITFRNLVSSLVMLISSKLFKVHGTTAYVQFLAIHSIVMEHY